MLKVGLTGGIGSGKTTVSKLFAELNVPNIDADEISHLLVEPGQPALLDITKTFGERILNSNGTLNRDYMRDTVFTSPIRKKQLEAILHPLIFKTMQDKIDLLNSPYCIVSIPLLFETGMTAFVDRVLVIDCPVELQIERVKRRNNLPETRIQSIIDSQVSREFRKTNADDVLDNSGNGSELADQVKKLHNLYLSFSASLG